MRYFLVDRVTEHVPGERARGVKNVTLTDEVLHDHFPDHPIFPGALLVEALAQLAGFVLEAGAGEPCRRAILGQIDRTKFFTPATPGDQIDLRVTVTSKLDAAARVAGEAYVEGRQIARAELTFMLVEVADGPVHAQRRALYRIWTRALEGRAVGS